MRAEAGAATASLPTLGTNKDSPDGPRIRDSLLSWEHNGELQTGRNLQGAVWSPAEQVHTNVSREGWTDGQLGSADVLTSHGTRSDFTGSHCPLPVCQTRQHRTRAQAAPAGRTSSGRGWPACGPCVSRARHLAPAHARVVPVPLCAWMTHLPRGGRSPCSRRPRAIVP